MGMTTMFRGREVVDAVEMISHLLTPLHHACCLIEFAGAAVVMLH